METCYKFFKRYVLMDIELHSTGIDFEPESAAKLLKRNVRIYEIPILHNPRDYSEGKIDSSA